MSAGPRSRNSYFGCSARIRKPSSLPSPRAIRELAERMFAEIQRLVPDRRHFLVKPEEFERAIDAANLPAASPAISRLSDRPSPGVAGSATRDTARCGARRFSRANEDPGLQRAAGAASTERSAPRSRLCCSCRRSARPDLSSPQVAGAVEEGPFDLSLQGPGDRRPADVAAPPPGRGGQPLFSVPARARRRGADLQSAARDVGRVRHFSVRFRDAETADDLQPVLELCARVILVEKPRYREPRWSTLAPPEVHEFRSPAMFAALARVRAEYKIEAVQVEYTMLAPYAGDVLVEHDVTFELYRQIRDARPASPRVGTIAAGGDSRGNGSGDIAKWWSCRSRIARCSQRPERRRDPQRRGPGAIHSRDRAPRPAAAVHRIVPPFPEHRRVSIFRRAGLADPAQTFFRDHVDRGRRSGSLALLARAHRPRFHPAATIASVCSNSSPTFARCMSKPISPSSPRSSRPARISRFWRRWRWIARWCPRPRVAPGLGLEHGVNVWIADQAEDFARAIETLLEDHDLPPPHRRGRPRPRGAKLRLESDRRAAARAAAGVDAPARADPARPGARHPRDRRHPATAPESSQWQAQDYLAFDCQVALIGRPHRRIPGFPVRGR